ncbi:MAG: amidohydrolase [Succinivibrio sp.]|nr:amidohydrolase [Succinivibrio sp.]
MKKTLTALTSALLISTAQAEIADVHSHYIGAEYVQYLAEHDLSLKEGFPLPPWQLEDTLSFMQKAGITTSVLSLAPVHPYADEYSPQFIRKLNEQMATLKQRYPGRFLIAATLPLPDVRAAMAEAVYALDVLKADGIALGSNTDGQYLGDDELEPLMQLLDERAAVLIVHPHKPAGLPDQLFRTTPLAMFEYPADTTRAVVNLIMHNTLVRYPHLKMVIPHGGSLLGLTIPRLKAIYPVVRARNLVGELDIEGSLKSLYFDLAGVENIETVRNMLSYTTPEHLLYGSDYPYFKEEVLLHNLSALKEKLLDDPNLKAYVADILGGNALRLFSRAGSEN